jgi:hypothetical protein
MTYRVFIKLRGRWTPTSDASDSAEALAGAVRGWLYAYPAHRIRIQRV